MAKKKLELQWQKLGEGILADWRACVDDKRGVRLEQVSTGVNWGPWHMRNEETLVSADTLRAKSLVKQAASAEDRNHKGVPQEVLEALESYAAARLKEPAQPPSADAQGSTAEKAPELRVLLPAFEQLAKGEYVLDVSEGPLATWKVRVVEDVSPKAARLELEEPGVDKPIHHGPYAFDAEGGVLMGVGPGCYCGRPDTVPGADHSHVLDALARVEAALTADVEGTTAPVGESKPEPVEERPSIAGLSAEKVKGDLLRRWLRHAPEMGEGGMISHSVESLPVPLTPEGRLRKADLLTSTYEEDFDLDAEEKRLKEAIKRRREDVEKRRQTLVAEIQSRQEYRDVRTVEVLVLPMRQVWRVRTDTYAVVNREPMDLGHQAARVYSDDDTRAPFRAPVHVTVEEDGDGGDEAPVAQGSRPRKKRAPSSEALSLSLTTGQALGEEPEEQRRKAVPDATSDMTVAAPVKHRCQRARCGHSEADHSGSSGQCMAPIRVEREGVPGETCACTAYVPPPGARESKPEAATEKAQESAAVTSNSVDMPPETGEVVESLPEGWVARERATGWWLSHVEGPDNVGPFFAVAGSGGRFFVEQPQGRPDLDAWASGNEHVLNVLERELAKGAASFARHYLLGDDAPGWMLAVPERRDGLLSEVYVVRNTETSPALMWSTPRNEEPRLDALGSTDVEVESAAEWMNVHDAVMSAANAVIRRGDVRELSQPSDGVVLQ